MESKYNVSYLESLVGKEVQVNKGGPESKRGVILEVKPDYILLSCHDKRLIWYQTKHIKSLIENSKTNLSQSTEDEVKFGPAATDFIHMLETLVSETVQVNQGGPESKVGKLLSVKQDFFVLLTKEDGIVCYQIDHVKSLSLVQDTKNEEEKQKENQPDNQSENQTENQTENQSENQPDNQTENQTENQSENQTENQSENQPDNQTENVKTELNHLPKQEEETYEINENQEKFYKDIANLDELLFRMKYSFVSINSGGPEKIVGVLTDYSGDFLTIVVHEEVIRSSKFHLKSISKISIKEDNKDSSENAKESTEVEAKKEDLSGNNSGENKESKDKNDKKGTNNVSTENQDKIDGNTMNKENNKATNEKEKKNKNKESKQSDNEKEKKNKSKESKQSGNEKENQKNKKADRKKEDKKKSSKEKGKGK